MDDISEESRNIQTKYTLGARYKVVIFIVIIEKNEKFVSFYSQNVEKL